MNTTASTPSLRRLEVDPPIDDAAAASVCPHCGGRIDTATTATVEPAVEVAVELGRPLRVINGHLRSSS